MLELIFDAILVLGGIWAVIYKCMDTIKVATTDNIWINIFTRVLLWSLCTVCLLGLIYVYIDVHIYPLPPHN